MNVIDIISISLSVFSLMVLLESIRLRDRAELMEEIDEHAKNISKLCKDLVP